MEMRLAGHTYREIAAKLGIAVSAAHRHVQRACEAYAKREHQATEQLRTLTVAALNAQLQRWWSQADPPECPLHSPPGLEPEPGSVCRCDPVAVKAALKALDRVLKILAERSRLLAQVAHIVT